MLLKKLTVLLIVLLVVAACSPAASPTKAPATTAPTAASGSVATAAATSAASSGSSPTNTSDGQPTKDALAAFGSKTGTDTGTKSTEAAAPAATEAATEVATVAAAAATAQAVAMATEAPAASTEAVAAATSGASLMVGNGEELVWAFVPSENSQTVLDNAQQLADLVSAKTGFKIKIVVATSYAGVIEAMCNNQAQLASLNTFGYILAASRKCADVGLVSIRNGSTSYRGQVITKADSGIKTIADLKGKTFCRPDPLSTSGWIIPSITMKANGIDPETDLKQVQDVGGHDAVVENVYNGNCDAGSTFDDARANLKEKHADVEEKVIVLEYSAAIPNDTISFLPSMDQAKRDALQSAIIEVASDPANADLLKKVYNWNGVQVAKDAFFDDFRQALDTAGVKVETLLPTPKPAATAAATEAAAAATEAPAAATMAATP